MSPRSISTKSAVDRHEVLLQVVDLVILEVAERQRHLDQQALKASPRRIEDVIAGVTRPAAGEHIAVGDAAELRDVQDIGRRAVGDEAQLGVLVTEAHLTVSVSVIGTPKLSRRRTSTTCTATRDRPGSVFRWYTSIVRDIPSTV